MSVKDAKSLSMNNPLGKSEGQLRAFITAGFDVVYRMNADWSEMHFLQGRDFIPDTQEPSSTWIEKYIHPAEHRS